MKKRLAKILIISGIVCVIAALSLFVYNKAASSNAARFSEEIVSQLQTTVYQDIGYGEIPVLP